MSSVTKNVLAASLKKLLSKRELSKITIYDIVNECGVNRQTFYYHFKDIYDLLEWTYEHELIDKVEEKANLGNWQENVNQIFKYLIENKRFVINTYNSISREYLLNVLFNQYNNFIFKLIEEAAPEYNVNEADKLFIATFYKYGFTGIIEEWIMSNMSEDPDILLKKLDIMISGSFEEALKRMSN